ncbi:hypothetical protein NBRC111894_661 [Sporolactobacillus inulinus]|uniref:Uncharacterized protein n=1 Tax=Sporolactobacillus inulinus TaxID=2078 RepID=A0A4Y1Z7V3_9BACL|nr:hypothetical protein NBRC111894_661 [Sporolactobacillus inulinus]
MPANHLHLCRYFVIKCSMVFQMQSFPILVRFIGKRESYNVANAWDE